MALRARPSLALVAISLSVAGGVLDGCGSSSTPDVAATPDGGDVSVADASSERDGAAEAARCARRAVPADRPRKVVVSHPFLATGAKAKVYEVLDLSVDGALSRPTPPITFSMGTGLSSPILFTPDGEVGLVAQDDGSIGVFRLPATGGAPVVVHAAFKEGFDAGRLLLSPDGARAWVLDPNTANNRGGVYELAIACDGTLSSLGLVIPGGGATAMALLPGDPSKALLASQKAFDSPPNTDVHLVDLTSHSLIGSAAAFDGLEAIVSSIAVMPDGKYALVADDGPSAGSRVAVVALTPAVARVGVLQTPFPAAVVASPFGNAAIVLNDDSTDQIHVLSYDPTNKAAPFVITGELAYKFPKPQIPVTASTIDRGALRGSVFIGENLGVRKVVFAANGGVKDAAKLPFPDAMETIVGVVGVQP